MPRRKRNQVIDGADARIIAQLARDGRKPNVAIAQEVGLSETAVRRRLERLLRNGIVRVVGRLNPETIGYEVDAILALLVDFNKVDEVGEKLSREPNVRYAAVGLGEYDLLVWVSFRSNAEMMEFVASKVRNVPGIIRCQVYPVLRTIRRPEDWAPPLPA
ncbi:MAG: Lrp/AsnC family transcriptional regulator [Chloroflexi bacterium]|nr:Lrp/AsnC family transcriptional regulator [Chloroflexota bacterium]